jgi:hypothetical protein
MLVVVRFAVELFWAELVAVAFFAVAFDAAIFFAVAFDAATFFAVAFDAAAFFAVVFFAVVFFAVVFFAVVFNAVLFFAVVFFAVVFNAVLFFAVAFNAVLFFAVALFVAACEAALSSASSSSRRRACVWQTRPVSVAAHRVSSRHAASMVKRSRLWRRPSDGVQDSPRHLQAGPRARPRVPLAHGDRAGRAHGLRGREPLGKIDGDDGALLLKQTLEAPFDPGPLLLRDGHVELTSFD